MAVPFEFPGGLPVPRGGARPIVTDGGATAVFRYRGTVQDGLELYRALVSKGLRIDREQSFDRVASISFWGWPKQFYLSVYFICYDLESTVLNCKGAVTLKKHDRNWLERINSPQAAAIDSASSGADVALFARISAEHLVLVSGAVERRLRLDGSEPRRLSSNGCSINIPAVSTDDRIEEMTLELALPCDITPGRYDISTYSLEAVPAVNLVSKPTIRVFWDGSRTAPQWGNSEVLRGSIAFVSRTPLQGHYYATLRGPDGVILDVVGAFKISGVWPWKDEVG